LQQQPASAAIHGPFLSLGALLISLAGAAVFLAGSSAFAVSRVVSGADLIVSLNDPLVALTGLILLCLYFAASLFNLLPFFPGPRLRVAGILLHFCILPVSVALIEVGQISLRSHDFLSLLAFHFALLLRFGLICFRVYERRYRIAQEV
jgi:hypothetical protein